MPRITRKHALVGLGVGVLLCLAAVWVLLTPDNPFTKLFRSKMVESGSRVITGPYPVDEDFPLLKSQGVKTIVSLLDPTVPYESVLLEREKNLAEKHGVKMVNTPLRSIFGQRLNVDYDARAAKAAEAVDLESRTGKVYLHCYLGKHRMKAVETALADRGTASKTFAMYQVDESGYSRQLDLAEDEFGEGKYQAALDILKPYKKLDAAGLTLKGWCNYHLGKISAARALFAEVVRTAPEELDAHLGLGYCALRGNELSTADREFSLVVSAQPQNASGLCGLGIARYRQGKPAEAARHLKAALKLDPANKEARQILARIRT